MTTLPLPAPTPAPANQSNAEQPRAAPSKRPAGPQFPAPPPAPANEGNAETPRAATSKRPAGPQFRAPANEGYAERSPAAPANESYADRSPAAPANPETTERTPANEGYAERSPAALPLPALVFCRSRKRVESVARDLASTLGGERVGAYHAGLSKQERTAIERWFFAADDAVLVATCAYGMGVDKSNIRTTIHYDLPGSVEAFLQESGRGGRDGGAAESIVLFGQDDGRQQEQVSDATRRERYGRMLGYCDTPGCRRAFLMELLGSQCEVCFGCDNCRSAVGPGEKPAGSRMSPGASDRLATTAAETLAASRVTETLIRKNPRLLTTEQTARVLRCQMEPGDRWILRRLPKRRSTIQTRRWTHAEVMELIDGLIAVGRVRRVTKGPWRGRLAPGRTGRPGLVRPHSTGSHTARILEGDD